MFAKRMWISALLSFLFAGIAAAQTTGFITTRPTCTPPNLGQDPLNYIQGPDPIRLPNGDVAIMVNAGKVTFEGSNHWEGIFSLIYPAAGRAATPRFSGIWASDDFQTDTTRNEKETAFPSPILYGGKWRIGYVATFRCCEQNRDRMARLDLDNLTYRAAQSQVTNVWIKPVDPICRTLGSCPSPDPNDPRKGTGINGTFVLHPNNDLFVYHPDMSSGCVSRWMRHKINADMSVANVAGNGCITLNGFTKAPTWVSDIGRGADNSADNNANNLYMLTADEGFGFIEEWVSTGDAFNIGLTWNRTGRKWLPPAHPNAANGWIYGVWDAGFLKDSNRRLIQPKVVVSQISDGAADNTKNPPTSAWQEIAQVRNNRWYLYYWADAGASLPPTFGQDASSCAFGGVHETATCSSITGWAWDPTFPNSPISVDIFDGSTLIATVAANQFRQDLLNSGKGNGVHGFSWPVPASLKNNLSHSISVKYAGTETRLSGSPKTINCPPTTTTYALTVSKSGSGTVTSSPAGINCGTDCAENYNSGTVVNLTATPAAGSTFAGWSGHSDCTDGSVTMTAARSCTATFNSSVTARTIWIQPQRTAGFGPPGSLVLAGSASGAPAGTGVALTWRNLTTLGPWITEGYAPSPDSSGYWYHSIANANSFQRYEVYVTYGGFQSVHCVYQGTDSITWCP